jgi:hypothetical protein
MKRSGLNNFRASELMWSVEGSEIVSLTPLHGGPEQDKKKGQSSSILERDQE